MPSGSLEFFLTFMGCSLENEIPVNHEICSVKHLTRAELNYTLLKEVWILLVKKLPSREQIHVGKWARVIIILNFLILFLGSQHKSSNVSFLFSLRNPNNMQPFKCPIINGKNCYAIHCHSSCGARFGGGCDLHIVNNANTNQSSGSNLGDTYQAPAGYQYGTPQTQSLFAGSRNFTPTEIEVFF